MKDQKLRAAIALYDRFTHEGMDRRDFMARLTRIAGRAAAALPAIIVIRPKKSRRSMPSWVKRS